MRLIGRPGRAQRHNQIAAEIVGRGPQTQRQATIVKRCMAGGRNRTGPDRSPMPATLLGTADWTSGVAPERGGKHGPPATDWRPESRRPLLRRLPTKSENSSATHRGPRPRGPGLRRPAVTPVCVSPTPIWPPRRAAPSVAHPATPPPPRVVGGDRFSVADRVHGGKPQIRKIWLLKRNL